MKLGISSWPRGSEAMRLLTEEWASEVSAVRSELSLTSTGPEKLPLPRPSGSYPRSLWDKTGTRCTVGFVPLQAGFTTVTCRQDSDAAVSPGGSLKPTQTKSTRFKNLGRFLRRLVTQ